MVRKLFQTKWNFPTPDAILTCSTLNCNGKQFIAFGGHDKILYLIDDTLSIIDKKDFNGWVRCTFPKDLDGDGCDELLVGTGNGITAVMKYEKDQKKLVEIMNYKSVGKISCCIAGDIYKDGNSELIFGGEDKLLKIFKDTNSTEPSIVLNYDSWVMACALGFFMLSDSSKSLYGLLVGTKNGILQLIQIKENKPEIIWEKNFHSQINNIKVGDVFNNGLNEILLCTNDSSIKILNNSGILQKEIKIAESHPISLIVEDIDGDNAKEIVAGCADGSLRVYHNTNINSTNFHLKWKKKVESSIIDICSFLDEQQNIVNIIFGGYDCTLRNIIDFEWAQKPTLNIKPMDLILKEKSLIEELKLHRVTQLINEGKKIIEIGKTLKEQKKFDKSVVTFEKALKIVQKSTNSEEKRELIDSINNLIREVYSIQIEEIIDQGNNLREQEKFDESIATFEQVLELIKRIPNLEKKQEFNIVGKLINQTKVMKIKKIVLEMGTKFGRLQVVEIAEESGEDHNLIIITIKDMIKKREIYAKYFESSKSVVFDQKANIDEIDQLMETYREWEEKEFGKKKI